MWCKYSSCLAIACNEHQRYCIAGVQRNQSLNIDLTSHVCRCCVASGLERMVSPLPRMILRLTGKDKPESFAHTARQHRSNLAEPTLLHRCHVTVQDRCEPVPSRYRHKQPEAIAQYANKTFSFTQMRGGQSPSIR
jgi:hypothetical protein